ncbi:hypothetical protein HETIRDRAFT_451211 [Heterobasidion irregulare TC 32-1]|uniref:Uncharacterized protein n=1 Tax=Heterobasidion irregulare (strain TC 32-1) TaxID=747525 RepID=W4K6I3_HETIT|nr:uncharacterized protein HETIRDRAFT_451211 [Heterobasidion irregulare TC 32-1]ETW81413.1 hypothetical protein HETIRDRAFT_451211 [Heterobasidion irregulare TC 32-1]
MQTNAAMLPASLLPADLAPHMNNTCEHPIVRGRRRADAPRRTLVSTPEPATGHPPREQHRRACKQILMEHAKGAPDDDESSSVGQHSHSSRAVHTWLAPASRSLFESLRSAQEVVVRSRPGNGKRVAARRWSRDTSTRAPMRRSPATPTHWFGDRSLVMQKNAIAHAVARFAFYNELLPANFPPRTGKTHASTPSFVDAADARRTDAPPRTRASPLVSTPNPQPATVHVPQKTHDAATHASPVSRATISQPAGARANTASSTPPQVRSPVPHPSKTGTPPTRLQTRSDGTREGNFRRRARSGRVQSSSAAFYSTRYVGSI